MIPTLSAIQDLKVLWDETGGPWAGFAPLAGEDRCDVAVIGGGFTGLSAALRLASEGANVSLIEADTIGFRASGRNGGQSVPGLKPRADSVIATFGVERGRRMLDFAHQPADRTAPAPRTRPGSSRSGSERNRTCAGQSGQMSGRRPDEQGRASGARALSRREQ